MAFKFLRGDIVRQIGKPDDLIVAHADEHGQRYLLAQNPDSLAPQTWASEDELELVKRASDNESGWRLQCIN
jgi:hypothetical protein